MSQPWILIPVYNRREITLACLRHLHELEVGHRFVVAVIDDGSTDGTCESIRLMFPGVRLIHGGGDLWWTGAIALGMKAAALEHAPCVIWLNDDCLPEPGALDLLTVRATESPPSVVGAVCVSDRTGKCIETGFIKRRAYSTPREGESEIHVEGLSGFCVAVPQAAWQLVGMPDGTRFPHYRGDSAYTVKLRQYGFPILLSASARAILVNYEPRARSVREYIERLESTKRKYGEVFLSNKSPFKLSTEWHYLRLRYGFLVGTGFAILRFVGWNLDYVRGAWKMTRISTR